MSPSLIPPIDLHPASEVDRMALTRLLHAVGWEDRYVSGQLASLAAATADPQHHGVFLASTNVSLLGFISVHFRAWNRLGQIHGLVVDPAAQRRGIGTQLVDRAERYIRERGGRGIYVDTPVINLIARSFYRAMGYREDYTMTSCYDDDLDGVTSVKFFQKEAEIA